MCWGVPRWRRLNRLMSGEAALIWCPFPDEDSARHCIAALLDARLIACGNILAGMQSLFAWNGALDESAECGALCKTVAPRLTEAMARLRALHPYEAPAILAWSVEADTCTLAWLKQETGCE